MSLINGPGRTPEVGETVATYKKYEGAQKAVSTLIEKNVPARDIAIVGSGLRSIEKVTGKLGWGRAALQGAINGTIMGLLFAAFVVIWSPGSDIALLGGILLVGVSVGMMFRVIGYMIVRRRRDYASIMAVAAEHYEVTVSAQHTTSAREALGTSKPRTVVPQPSSSEPPRYGVRVVDGAQQDPSAAPRPEADGAVPAPETTNPASSEENAGPSETAAQRD